MEFEEVEDEEWDTRKYSSKNNAANGCMMRWVLKRGICVGKKILVAGFVASAASVVAPPLAVASAVGIAVSMPCAVFLASYVCTQNLMSKLLPRPTLQDPPLLKEMCFQQGGSDDMQIFREEQALVEEGICEGANERGQKIGSVEDMEEALVEAPSSTIGGTEEDLNLREEMLHSRSGESIDTLLEGKEFDTKNDSRNSLAEPSELLIPAEPIEGLPTETLVDNITMDENSSEDSSEVMISEKIDMHQGKLDHNISDIENQESHQMHELNERMDLEDAEAREIGNESALDLVDGKQIDPDENTYTIDLHEESSIIDRRTDSMDVLVSSVEQESWPSECSSEENIICPSEEVNNSPSVVLDDDDDEKMWKEINVMKKIVGYEGRKEASCAEELKALYIFTGVEPPTSLTENTINPIEIKEKLHLLMSILGIKSNMT